MALEKQLMGRASALLPLLQDEEVTDILINGPRTLFVDRHGKLSRLESPFDDPASIGDFIERLLIPIGKRIDSAHPYIEGRLVDGSRFHILLPPVASGGPFISIRKLGRGSQCALASFGSVEIVDWLRTQVHNRQNILICGGTGTGKTTLLTKLLDEVPATERIAILEESREIQTSHPHAVRLEARTASPDGTGEVTLRCLIRNTLRMRPDRILLGECRGEEAFDLIQAMNTGHPGSFSTLHANSAQDALKRLESLTLLSGFQIPLRAIREWIASAIQVVVFLQRRDDERKIAEVMTVSGLEGEVYRVSPRYRQLEDRVRGQESGIRGL